MKKADLNLLFDKHLNLIKILKMFNFYLIPIKFTWLWITLNHQYSKMISKLSFLSFRIKKDRILRRGLLFKINPEL